MDEHDDEHDEAERDSLLLRLYTGELAHGPAYELLPDAEPDEAPSLVQAAMLAHQDAAEHETDDGRSEVETPRRAALRYWGLGEDKYTVKCFRCGQMGHMSFTCQQEASAAHCALCGRVDHSERSCPFELCFYCHQPGHQKRHCTHQGPPPHIPCYYCGRSGHDPMDCHENKPRDYNDIYCANCAAIGHMARQCRELHADDLKSRGITQGWQHVTELVKRAHKSGELERRRREKDLQQRRLTSRVDDADDVHDVGAEPRRLKKRKRETSSAVLVQSGSGEAVRVRDVHDLDDYEVYEVLSDDSAQTADPPKKRHKKLRGTHNAPD